MKKNVIEEYCGELAQRDDGVWQLPSQGLVHYPAQGHDANAEVEDHSFWFRHRNNCLLASLVNFPPSGLLFDVGGGNGFVTRALCEAGYPAVLVEPRASGVAIARGRGVADIIMARFDDIPFRGQSLPAIGLFDVLEHIEQDALFLSSLKSKLQSGARLYLTVPALPALWSAEDEWAEHFRRYRKTDLEHVLWTAGFTLEFFTPIFSFLIAPIFCARTLPTRLGIKRHNPNKYRREHTESNLAGQILSAFEYYEIGRVRAKAPLAFGSSYLVVARA